MSLLRRRLWPDAGLEQLVSDSSLMRLVRRKILFRSYSSCWRHEWSLSLVLRTHRISLSLVALYWDSICTTESCRPTCSYYHERFSQPTVKEERVWKLKIDSQGIRSVYSKVLSHFASAYNNWNNEVQIPAMNSMTFWWLSCCWNNLFTCIRLKLWIMKLATTVLIV